MADGPPARYDWLGIHEEMLQDRVRVEAYRQGILGNAALFRGRRVLEVGCGTGILSLFAAKAGAAVVYAVDTEAICTEMTRKVAAANGFEEVVKPFLGRVEEVELPSKVDILISEWMGYFLLYEGMLDAVLEAKRRFLEPGGIVFPTVVELFVAPFTDAPMQGERRRFWSDVGGMDLSSLLPEVLGEFAAEPRIEGLAFDQLLHEPMRLWRHDFREDAPSGHTDIQAAFSWHCAPGVEAHGYVGWFDCHFDASPLRVAKSLRTEGLSGAALAQQLAKAFAARFGTGTEEAGAQSRNVDDRPRGEVLAGSGEAGRDEDRGCAAGSRAAGEEVRAAAPVLLSTAPGAPRTHWHHTLFFLTEPIRGGETVRADFRVEVDAGSKGWVNFRVQHQLVSAATDDAEQTEPRTSSQAWLLRSYAQEGLRAPPLPTARTWLYALADAIAGRASRSQESRKRRRGDGDAAAERASGADGGSA